MGRLTLGKEPESVIKIVLFPLHDDGQASIEVHYRYRTRRELEEFLQSAYSDHMQKVDTKADSPLSKTIKLTDIDTRLFILQIVKGWNLDEEFSPDAVEALCDECPSAANAIIENYRAALSEGRIENLRQIAIAKYQKVDTDELALFGLKSEDVFKPVEVWPENQKSVELFIRMQTQWRDGMNGRTGMDYMALYPLLDRAAKDSDDWDELFEDVRFLESVSLETMFKNLEDKQ